MGKSSILRVLAALGLVFQMAPMPFEANIPPSKRLSVIFPSEALVPGDLFFTNSMSPADRIVAILRLPDHHNDVVMHIAQTIHSIRTALPHSSKNATFLNVLINDNRQIQSITLEQPDAVDLIGTELALHQQTHHLIPGHHRIRFHLGWCQAALYEALYMHWMCALTVDDLRRWVIERIATFNEDKHVYLSKEEEWLWVLARDRGVEDDLITNLALHILSALIRKLTLQYMNKWGLSDDTFDDLYQESLIAIYRFCLPKFVPSGGARLSSLASKLAINNFSKTNKRLFSGNVRTPKGDAATSKIILATQKTLQNRLGRKVYATEVATDLGMPLAKTAWIDPPNHREQSFNPNVEAFNVPGSLDTMSHMAMEQRAMIADAIARLPLRVSVILLLRSETYGLSFETIAKLFGVTVMMIRWQISSMPTYWKKGADHTSRQANNSLVPFAFLLADQAVTIADAEKEITPIQKMIQEVLARNNELPSIESIRQQSKMSDLTDQQISLIMLLLQVWHDENKAPSKSLVRLLQAV